MADLCGDIACENGSVLVAESLDVLVTECFVDSSLNRAGKVWKGAYPYFKKQRDRIPYKPPYSKPNLDYLEEEELLIFTSLDE